MKPWKQVWLDLPEYTQLSILSVGPIHRMCLSIYLSIYLFRHEQAVDFPVFGMVHGLSYLFGGIRHWTLDIDHVVGVFDIVWYWVVLLSYTASIGYWN